MEDNILLWKDFEADFRKLEQFLQEASDGVQSTIDTGVDIKDIQSEKERMKVI